MSSTTRRHVTLGELERESGGVIQTGPFGSQLHASDYSDIGTPVVMPTNIRDLRISTERIARVSDDHIARLSRHKLRPGDIVYSRRGDVEKCALIDEGQAGWLCGTGCLLVRVEGPGVDARCLAYLLSLPATRSWISQRAVGATMPNLNTAILREVPVDLPPIEEQRGIAATLGALDDKIKSNARAQSLIEQLVRSEFERAFPAEHEQSGTPISDLVYVNPLRSLPRGIRATYVGMSSLPEHSAEVIEWEQKEYSSGQKFINGDVLMARITPCLENGKTAVVDMLDSDAVGWGSTEYIVLAPRGPVSTPWVYCLVRSEPVRAYAMRSMTGTSGRQRFQAGGFDNYLISEPRAESLERFNKMAEPLFEQMTAFRDQNRALAALRDTLLPELLSGRLRMPEAREAVGVAV